MLNNDIKQGAAILILAGIVCLMTAAASDAGDVAIMNKEALKDLLGNDNVIILDVRRGRDWASSEFKIQGAQRAKPKNFEQWQANFPKDKTLVLYCA